MTTEIKPINFVEEMKNNMKLFENGEISKMVLMILVWSIGIIFAIVGLVIALVQVIYRGIKKIAPNKRARRMLIGGVILLVIVIFLLVKFTTIMAVVFGIMLVGIVVYYYYQTNINTVQPL